jgi:hypothetical protein
MPRASERAVELAKEVLAKIAAYDGQFLKPNPATVLAWAEHISLRNPTREDMLAAVTKFYETNEGGVKPLPASISNIAQSMRQDRLMRESTQARQAREDARDEQLADEPLSIGSAKPRGTYVNEDPAGWSYGNAVTKADREAMRVELDARIDQFLVKYPKASRGDAETAIRTGDRERAEKLLKQMSRSIGHVVGSRHPGEVERAFSEPIRGGDDG